MKKKKTVKRKRFYGMVKIGPGTKMRFLSVENKHGWALGLALNNQTVWLRNVRFQDKKLVQKAVGSKVVFINKKGK